MRLRIVLNVVRKNLGVVSRAIKALRCGADAICPPGVRLAIPPTDSCGETQGRASASWWAEPGPQRTIENPGNPRHCAALSDQTVGPDAGDVAKRNAPGMYLESRSGRE